MAKVCSRGASFLYPLNGVMASWRSYIKVGPDFLGESVCEIWYLRHESKPLANIFRLTFWPSHFAVKIWNEDDKPLNWTYAKASSSAKMFHCHDDSSSYIMNFQARSETCDLHWKWWWHLASHGKKRWWVEEMCHKTDTGSQPCNWNLRAAPGQQKLFRCRLLMPPFHIKKETKCIRTLLKMFKTCCGKCVKAFDLSKKEWQLYFSSPIFSRRKSSKAIFVQQSYCTWQWCISRSHYWDVVHHFLDHYDWPT